MRLVKMIELLVLTVFVIICIIAGESTKQPATNFSAAKMVSGNTPFIKIRTN